MDEFVFCEHVIQSENDKIKFIANHYGLWHQLGKLSEECSELSIEAIKSINEGRLTVNIVQEIADVEIMLEQIKHLAGIDEALVKGAKTYKINRQIMRMRQEEKKDVHMQ